MLRFHFKKGVPKIAAPLQSSYEQHIGQITQEMIKLSDLARQYPLCGIEEYVTYLFERQTPADTHAVRRLGHLAEQGSIAPFGDPFLRDAMELARLRKFMLATDEGTNMFYAYERQKDRHACNLLRANAIIQLED
jgi:hypothetical protein